MKLFYKESTPLILIACIGIFGLWESFKPMTLAADSYQDPIPEVLTPANAVRTLGLPAAAQPAVRFAGMPASMEEEWSIADSIEVVLR